MLYIENAFRVLGLTANATLAVARDAYQTIRTRAKLGNFQSTNDYLSFICGLELNEADVRNAFNNINNDVRTRMKERLFWFSNTSEVDQSALEQLSKANFNEAIRIWESDKSITSTANLARIYHALCIFKDREVHDADLWRKTFSTWRIALENDDFWSHFIAIESESGFEPAATHEEIQDLRKNAWDLIIQHSKSIAVELLENNKDEEALRHLNIMRDSGFPSSVIYHAEDEVLAIIENKIQAVSDEILKELNDSLEKFNLIFDKRKACDHAYQCYKDELLSQVLRLEKFSSEDFWSYDKAREAVAKCLRSISISYHNEVEEFQIAERIAEEALELSEGTAISEKIKEDLPAISEHAVQQRVWKDLIPIDSAPPFRNPL